MTDHKACAEAFAADAQHAVETLADELIAVAGYLKRRAQGFASGQQLPTSLAASIVSDYTNMGGHSGARLLDLVYNAGKAEWHRARLETENHDRSRAVDSGG